MLLEARTIRLWRAKITNIGPGFFKLYKIK